jgi:Mn-dependent DtxR family transcriptional regulator
MTSTQTRTVMRVLTHIYQNSGVFFLHEIRQDLNTSPNETMAASRWLHGTGLIQHSSGHKLELTSKAYEQLVDRPGRPYEQVRDLVRMIVQENRS